MSFFRNLRSSITRGRSSSRDTTPVRSSRPGSVISGMGSSKRRDSVESSGNDSLFNRSGTFILDDPNENNGLHSNTSTMEKKSKKSKVLEKFSTFTKRKKTPAPDSSAPDHHPSDNATNTYYKWQADGANSLDYDSQTDPFNFLYEQTSLKSLHNGSSASATAANDSPRVVHSTTPSSPLSSNGHTTFDSSTYRKGKMPTELKKQLEQLKQSRNLPEQEDDEPAGNNEADEEDYFKRTGLENDNEADKYKTVTLNSFRKSFRDKFLQQQKEATYNPAWFVEVDPPAESTKVAQRQRSISKENRNDFLVFDNDNYRPGSRSPVRDLNSRKTARSSTRSPVKRTETFKVERSGTPRTHGKTEETTPSIRIEFRNSITPHMPGRMVPVGVAKPMPSQITSPPPYYATRPETVMNTSYTIKTSKTRLNGSQSPHRNWSKPMSRSPSRPRLTGSSNPAATTTGRYQTLVQIKNETNTKLQQPVPLTTRPSRLSTRIQLGASSPGLPTSVNSNSSPSFAKRYASSHQTNGRSQPLKQTYFGDNNHNQHQHHYSSNTTSSPLTSTRMVQSPGYASSNTTTTTTTTTRTYGQKNATTPPVFHSKYQASNASSSFPSQLQSRSTPSHSVGGGGGGGGSVPSYLKHQQQQQSRFVVPAQRRSRSPIKIPWR